MAMETWLAVASGVRWRQGRLDSARGLLLAWKLMLPSGFVAILSGWFVTELGRQPWVIYGQLRTAEAVSQVDGASVALSLGIYILAYAVVFGFGSAYILRMLGRGPLPHEPEPETEGGERTPARPLSAADASLEEGAR